MRTLKFRLWDKENNRFSTTSSTLLLRLSNFFKKNKIEKYGFSDSTYHRFIIQQFTGKLDNNNKELYEGDIVSWNFRPCDLGESEEGISEVYYDEKSACFLFDRFYNYDFIIHNLHFEIIGNIFENIKLLEQLNAF